MGNRLIEAKGRVQTAVQATLEERRHQARVNHMYREAMGDVDRIQSAIYAAVSQAKPAPEPPLKGFAKVVAKVKGATAKSKKALRFIREEMSEKGHPSPTERNGEALRRETELFAAVIRAEDEKALRGLPPEIAKLIADATSMMGDQGGYPHRVIPTDRNAQGKR
jgi:hypothetical protein